MKRRGKIAVDIVMFALFLYLLSYRPGMGLLYHAVIGILQLTLFLLHHALNLPWYKAIFRGKYSYERILLVLVDFLLTVAMIMMIVSSIMISGMIFEFGIRMTGWWRRVHVAASAWCFLLMTVHVGMHTRGLLNRIKRRMDRHGWLFGALEALLVGTGIWCFLASDLLPKLMMARKQPLSTLTSEMFLGIYLGIVAGMCVLVRWICILPKRKAAVRKN